MSINSHGELDAQRTEREATKRMQQMSDNARHAERHYQDNLRQSQQEGQTHLPAPDTNLEPQPSALPLVYAQSTGHESAILRLLRLPYRFISWLLRPLGGNVRDVVVVGLILTAMVALAYIVYMVGTGL